MKTAFLAFLLLPGALLAQSPADDRSKSLVLTNVTVIDGTGAPAKPVMTVAIRGNRIVAIRSSAGFQTPANSQVVDATGKFLIPGLWDKWVCRTLDESFGVMPVRSTVTEKVTDRELRQPSPRS
jgi:predicted amidohydrolase